MVDSEALVQGDETNSPASIEVEVSTLEAASDSGQGTDPDSGNDVEKPFFLVKNRKCGQKVTKA